MTMGLPRVRRPDLKPDVTLRARAANRRFDGEEIAAGRQAGDRECVLQIGRPGRAESVWFEIA